MKTAFALRNFKSLGDIPLENKALTVYAAMNGNTYFPNPTPAMAELNENIQQYSAALAQAKNRDLYKIAQKKIVRAKLEDTLTMLALYVNFVSGGNRAMLLTTGFTISTETTTTATFDGEINNLKVTQGANAGELLISFKPVQKKRTYIICYGESPIQNDYWKIETTHETTFTISGLQRGKEYSIRVGVVSPQGKTFYAAIITIMVA